MSDRPEWPSEEIPDSDQLFMRVHEMWRRGESVSPGAFQNHNGAMSVDWERYAEPYETRRRAQAPEKNAVVSLRVGKVRSVPGQVVQHTPDIDRKNRAHTDVAGDKDEEVRIQLRRCAGVVIAFDAPAD